MSRATVHLGDWATELLRVAKPGAHLVAFGGTRTFHRLICAIEDAGWEIRDTLMWLYGSGFPKSLDVSKAMDKAVGAPRHTRLVQHAGQSGSLSGPRINVVDSGEPASLLAEQWDGWGTALKPAWEPIILARKPLAGTVAQNVTEHGTGALNVDGCRIEGAKGNGVWGSDQSGQEASVFIAKYGRRTEQHVAGRWPANVVLDEEAAQMLDTQSGERRGCSTASTKKGVGQFSWVNARDPQADRLASGGHADRGPPSSAPGGYGQLTPKNLEAPPVSPYHSRFSEQGSLFTMGHVA